MKITGSYEQNIDLYASCCLSFNKLSVNMLLLSMRIFIQLRRLMLGNIKIKVLLIFRFLTQSW